ncbi:RNA helicase [Babesia caballi]|uniref:ATP-dependent RNA helicase n=1 Tax=Babesia caballi TaxID=5871 RepID=A0AAV4LYM6_BABCB|nr:RNA helicase [Babesia caballi]
MNDDADDTVQGRGEALDGDDAATLDAFLKALGEVETDFNGNHEEFVANTGATIGSEQESQTDCNTQCKTPDPISQNHLNDETKSNHNLEDGATNMSLTVPDKERESLPNIYRVDEAVDALSLQEVVRLKKRLGIETTGMRVPKPIGSFLHMSSSITPGLQRRMQHMGYTEPTPIQCQAMPVLLQGRNAILMGESGCGKTLAYLVPLICHILSLIRESRAVAPRRCAFGVIMALTRETSHQICLILSKLLKSLGMRVATITTGYDNYNQVISGTEFLIVTPAKLRDLLNQNCLTVDAARFVVLEDFPKIYQKHPDEVETLLNHQTATKVVVSNVILGAETLNVMRQYLKASVTVKYLVVPSLSGLTLKWISCLKEPSRVQKTTFLGDLLSHFHQAFRMVIFANERATVENLCQFITHITESVAFLHEEVVRDVVAATLEQFRTGGLRILVTTDMLLKHVTLPSIDYVVIFDMPRNFSRFCGRVTVARTHEKAVVYSLLAKYDHVVCAHICHQLTEEGLPLPRVVEQVALNWKPYRDSRQNRRDFGTLIKEHKEVEVAMRVATAIAKGADDTGPTSASPSECVGATSPQCTVSTSQPPLTHAAAQSTDCNSSGAPSGRKYGVEDDLSSDDDADVVPKRQLVKPAGLIDLEKVKQRRTKMMENNYNL